MDSTWLGTRSSSCSNHHSDICVSTAPLSGIGDSSTKSYADIRSLATRSSWSALGSPEAGSSGAYRSRTLPE